MEIINELEPKNFAGFFHRLLAYIIDTLLLYFFQMFALGPFLALFGIAAISLDNVNTQNPEEFLPIIITFAGVFAMYALALSLVGWFYFAFMESSKKQATIGKMVLGIKVTDMQGNRISFLKATARYFGKILSGLFLFIGYIIAAFTEKKQALHDILAGCLVVNNKTIN